MYNLLVKLFITATLLQLGLSLKDFTGCSNQQCIQKLENARREVLKIDWKPISVFPAEARRFR